MPAFHHDNCNCCTGAIKSNKHVGKVLATAMDKNTQPCVLLPKWWCPHWKMVGEGRWLGETTFVQVSTTWALICPETVHQRRDHVRLNRENGPRTTIITYACCKFLGYATGTDRRTDRLTSLDRRICVQLGAASVITSLSCHARNDDRLKFI